MIRNTIKIQLSGILMFIACCTVFAQDIKPEMAAKLPSYYPQTFQASGVIGNIDLTSGILMINATQYRYDINVKVHSLNTQHSSLRTLKPGAEIGFNMNPRNLISEIWIMPADSLMLE